MVRFIFLFPSRLGMMKRKEDFLSETLGTIKMKDAESNGPTIHQQCFKELAIFMYLDHLTRTTNQGSQDPQSLIYVGSFKLCNSPKPNPSFQRDSWVDGCGLNMHCLAHFLIELQGKLIHLLYVITERADMKRRTQSTTQ